MTQRTQILALKKYHVQLYELNPSYNIHLYTIIYSITQTGLPKIVNWSYVIVGAHLCKIPSRYLRDTQQIFSECPTKSNLGP
jgi:hypothetical protein